MKTKITFHNMPHSDPLEEHARTKLQKIDELIGDMQELTPLFMELWLKANKQHAHHSVELHLKTPHFDLNAHDEGTDLYVACDNTIDKMAKMVKKEKSKFRDKHRKAETKKDKFSSDKYE